MTQTIFTEQICNLSRLPCSIRDNSYYQSVVDIRKGLTNCKESKLWEFYRDFCPSDLNDVFGVNIEALANIPYDYCFLPWLHYEPMSMFRDTAFVGPKDKSYIKNQYNELVDLTASIELHGYNPEDYLDRRMGHISGYYLENNGNKKFYVVGGNHRVAVLANLFDSFQVLIESREFSKPRDIEGTILEKSEYRETFSDKNISEWASVKSKFLTESEAKRILERYVC